MTSDVYDAVQGGLVGWDMQKIEMEVEKWGGRKIRPRVVMYQELGSLRLQLCN